MTTPRTTKNAIRGIINTGRGIGTIFLWQNGQRNFEKFAAENCGPSPYKLIQFSLHMRILGLGHRLPFLVVHMMHVPRSPEVENCITAVSRS